jgi:Flp pilus assembly protein TadG
MILTMNTTTSTTSATSATKRKAGVAALELGFFAPIFVVLLTGVAEIGRGAYEAMAVQSAVEAGMTYAANNDWNATAITNAVVNASGVTGLTATPAPTQFCACHNADCSGLSVVACTVTMCQQACASETPHAPGSYVQVNASLPHTTILSLPGIPSSFSATGIVRKQ